MGRVRSRPATSHRLLTTGATMDDDHQTISEAWIYTDHRRTGRVISHRKATDEQLRAILERRAAAGDPAAETDGPPAAGPYVEAGITTYTYGDDPPPPIGFEHDAAAHVFRLTTADGSVEVFRDNPTRSLCVEPDEEGGGMRPVMKDGRPVSLHLCREDREAR